MNIFRSTYLRQYRPVRKEMAWKHQFRKAPYRGLDLPVSPGHPKAATPHIFAVAMLSFVSHVALAALLRPVHTRRDLMSAAAIAGALPALPSCAAPTTFPNSVKLSNGQVFPLASFGLQIYDDATAERLTLLAIEAGFRNFFASVLARNQMGFARAIKRCGVPREDLFICGSVVSNRAIDEQSAYEFTKLGCQENMEAFGVGGITQLDVGRRGSNSRSASSAPDGLAAQHALHPVPSLSLSLSLSLSPAVRIPTLLADDGPRDVDSRRGR